MKHASLFSGIGGFDLAAEWMGWENIFHCEIAEFPRKILKYHFPNSICYEDIKKTDFTKHRGEIDIISGGFPCQPYSNAGKRRGKEDDRHLWPEMLRVIREIQPRFVVGENVAGLLSWNNGMVFQEIITDLENEGYETQAFLIPACATNAPHRRDRIWFIAHTNDSKQGNNFRENIGEEREIWWGKESNVFGELRGDGNATDTDSNGFKQQRGYDGSGKNDERSNTSVKWSSNTENINNANSSEFIKKQSEFNRRISKQTNGETKEFAITNRICKLDKEFNECKEIECRNKCKIDNSRTLVQKGQSRVQLSEYIGMEFDKTNLSSKSTNGHPDDKNGINRMEGNLADTDSSNNKTWTQRKILGQQNRQKTNGYSYVECRKQWENFPTQSPVCGGDDGISTQLDGITFSKWRNESIKGYGNAVVPQVVYQIFKAIEQSLVSL